MLSLAFTFVCIVSAVAVVSDYVASVYRHNVKISIFNVVKRNGSCAKSEGDRKFHSISWVLICGEHACESGTYIHTYTRITYIYIHIHLCLIRQFKFAVNNAARHFTSLCTYSVLRVENNQHSTAWKARCIHTYVYFRYLIKFFSL